MKKYRFISLLTILLPVSSGLSHAVLLADFDGGGVPYAEGSFEGPGAAGVTAGGPSELNTLSGPLQVLGFQSLFLF